MSRSQWATSPCSWPSLALASKARPKARSSGGVPPRARVPAKAMVRTWRPLREKSSSGLAPNKQGAPVQDRK
jgi:hypothetical protein